MSLTSVTWKAAVALLASVGLSGNHAANPRPVPPSQLDSAAVWMAPNGSDSGSNCRRFPTPVPNPDPTGASLCLTFQRAYAIASPGDTVGLVPTLGPYTAAGGITDDGRYHWAPPSDYVTFAPVPLGTRVTDAANLSLIGARHVRFRNIDFAYWYLGGNAPQLAQQTQDIWFDNTTVAHFDLHSVVGFKMTRGAVGGALGCGGTICTAGGRYRVTCPASCEPQIVTAYRASLGNQSILFDNVAFHDIGRAPGGAPHTSCLKVQATDGLTIRNSKFWNCDSQTLMLSFDTTQTGASWPYGDVNVVLSGNWIDAATDWSGTRGSVSGPLDLKATNRAQWDGSAISNWLIQNNTVNGSMYWSNDDGEQILASNVVFEWNLIRGVDCASGAAPSSGVSWRSNLSLSRPCVGSGNRRITYWPSCKTNGLAGLIYRKKRYVCR